MNYGDPGRVFDVSDVDAEHERLRRAEAIARALLDQRRRAYRLGREDALSSNFGDEPTWEQE